VMEEGEECGHGVILAKRRACAQQKTLQPHISLSQSFART
jgi:hypothetical protein